MSRSRLKDDQKSERRQEKDPDQQEQKSDHHIPVPPEKHQHQRHHWEHLPGSKRKPVRSFKSPGRK
jgi:hypothetical protein